MQNVLPSNPIPLLPARPSLLNRRVGWFGLFGVLTVWSLWQTGLFQKELINERGWSLTLRFFQASLSPELSPDFLWLTVDATLVTLAFAVCGTVLSLIFGFLGGILASEIWWESLFAHRGGRHWYRPLWLTIRGFFALLRAIHELIWGLFFVNVIGLDPLTAVLAIAIPFGAVTAKVYSEILDETPRQPLIALQNSGVHPAKAFIYTLLPQSFLDGLSYGFYRFECSIRAAAVLGIIGAGGLGYQIFLSLKTLQYEQIWTLFFALFILNGLADFWSAWLRRGLGTNINCSNGDCLDLEIITQSSRQLRLQQANRGVRISSLVVLFLIPFSFWYVQPDFGKLISPETVAHLDEVMRWSFPPDFRMPSPAVWVELSSITLAMSLLATVGAGIFGLMLSFPAANNFLLPGGLLDSGRKNISRKVGGVFILLLSRIFLLIARSVPAPIWALIFLFVLFPGILPGAIALGIYTVGVLGRLMAEVTENLDERPLSALKAQGAMGGQVFIYGVLPATIPRFIGYFLYRWEENIRATVVVGLVGAGGLGRLLTEELSRFNYQAVLTTLIIFVLLIFGVDVISTFTRRAFRER